MSMGSTLAVEQEEEKYRQDLRETNAERAAMLMHFRAMTEAEAIRVALDEIRVLEPSHPGQKQYDEDGQIIANLSYPEIVLPALGEQPLDVQEKIRGIKQDLLGRDVISD